jgi:hypothetical protein
MLAAGAGAGAGAVSVQSHTITVSTQFLHPDKQPPALIDWEGPPWLTFETGPGADRAHCTVPVPHHAPIAGRTHP